MVPRFGENTSHHRFGLSVVGVSFAQTAAQSFYRIVFGPPQLGIRKRMTLEILAATCTNQCRLVREVAIYGHSTDLGMRRDIARCCRRQSLVLVESNRRFDDFLASPVSALSAPLELIGACHVFHDTARFIKLDKPLLKRDNAFKETDCFTKMCQVP